MVTKNLTCQRRPQKDVAISELPIIPTLFLVAECKRVIEND